MGRKRKRRRSQHPLRQLTDKKKTKYDDTLLLLAGLKAFILAKYPDFLNQATFVPPVHMNHQHLIYYKLAEVDVHIAQEPVITLHGGGQGLQDSEVRDDEAQRLVLRCLRTLADCRSEVMTVVSKLRCEDYLSDPCYRPLADHLPTPRKMPNEYHRGDFDILVINPKYGILIVEIKTVGDRFNNKWFEEDKNGSVLERLKKAIEQLNKNKGVARYLVSDIHPSFPIRNAVALPNVKREQLQRILNREPSVKHALCRCLDIQTGEDPVSYCLSQDDLPTRDTSLNLENIDMTRLTEWWRMVFADNSSTRAMSDDDYTLLVARFCGPATYAPPFKVVKPEKRPTGSPMTDSRRRFIHSLGDAVSDIGDMFTRRVLTQSQIEVLANGHSLTFICGPPGTGKTVALMLKACLWLVLRHEVHVVSTWTGSKAASCLIASELLHVSPNAENRVHLHEFDLKDGDSAVQRAVSTLLMQAWQGELFVICDEAFGGSDFTDFCTQLKDQCKLHLWAGSVYNGYRPACLQEVSFDQALRTPPVITQQVMQSDIIKDGIVRPYRDYPAPHPCDGPPSIRIHHNHQGGHNGEWPGECEQCGVQLGVRLKQLCTGSFATIKLPSEGHALDSASDRTIGPWDVTTQLQLRDVFILTTHYDLEDEVLDDDGAVEQEACGVLKGLRQAGVRVRVVARSDSVAIASVAEMKGPDMVVAADADLVRGLERKVVVWIPYETNGNTSGEEDFGRLDAMSRTTAQLITFFSW